MRSKKNYKLFILNLFISLNLVAQTGDFEWANSMGGGFQNVGKSIVNDENGNVIITGYFEGTADFDPGVGTTNLTSNGGSDIFIQKLDANGNLIWVKQIGGIAFDSGQSIALDNDDNIYITGYFSDTVDFDPNADTLNLMFNGWSDSFILKLDIDGNLIWAKKMGGPNIDRGISIVLDAFNNVYTTGIFRDTVDFDPNIGITNLTANISDTYIQKLDTDGNLIWVKQITGNQLNSYNSGFGITIDNNNNVYITGSFKETSDFDPGIGSTYLTSNGHNDSFILKLDENGNYIWVKQIGGLNSEIGRSICTDRHGNVYITGSFGDTVDFNPNSGTYNLVSNGLQNVFILKLHPNGNFAWAKQFGGIGYDDVSNIKMDTYGNIYTIGEFSETVDFDPNTGATYLTSNGLRDIYIQKMNPYGNLVWVKQMGGVNDDFGLSISIDKINGSIYSTGAFINTVDFNPNAGTFNLTSNAMLDIFVQKLSIGTLGIEIDKTKTNISLKAYPNPTNGQLRIEFESMVNDAEISVFSINGKLMNNYIYNSSINSMDLNFENYADGIYIVEIKSSIIEQRIRVIKE